MAGAASAAEQLVERITALPELPYNDGYQQYFGNSQARAMRDPIHHRNFIASLEGNRLYGLFNHDENIKEFYEMYADPGTSPLIKFYFFERILQDKNPIIIRDPRYEIIRSKIHKQLFIPDSDLSKMLLYSQMFLLDRESTEEEKQTVLAAGKKEHDDALKFITVLIHPTRFLALREILGNTNVDSKHLEDRMKNTMASKSKGGKRHSKFKRKSKKVNRKKSRRRHRRSYYTDRKEK